MSFTLRAFHRGREFFATPRQAHLATVGPAHHAPADRLVSVEETWSSRSVLPIAVTVSPRALVRLLAAGVLCWCLAHCTLGLIVTAIVATGMALSHVATSEHVPDVRWHSTIDGP
jgi:hypothetical protein